MAYMYLYHFFLYSKEYVFVCVFFLCVCVVCVCVCVVCVCVWCVI